jgi:hypothetical protein
MLRWEQFLQQLSQIVALLRRYVIKEKLKAKGREDRRKRQKGEAAKWESRGTRQEVLLYSSYNKHSFSPPHDIDQ